MKLTQQKRLIMRRHRALTRFSIIDVPAEEPDTPRRRYVVTFILLILAIITSLIF